MARTLTLPLKVATDGTLGAITQGHPAEIAQSVALLLATRPGERRCNREYGYPDHVFTSNDLTVVDGEVVEQVVSDWEPRADVAAIDSALTGTTQTTCVHLEEA